MQIKGEVCLHLKIWCSSCRSGGGVGVFDVVAEGSGAYDSLGGSVVVVKQSRQRRWQWRGQGAPSWCGGPDRHRRGFVWGLWQQSRWGIEDPWRRHDQGCRHYRPRRRGWVRSLKDGVREVHAKASYDTSWVVTIKIKTRVIQRRVLKITVFDMFLLFTKIPPVKK